MPARVARDCLRHAAKRSENDLDWGSSSGSLVGVEGVEPLLFIAAVNALPSSFHDAPRRPVPLPLFCICYLSFTLLTMSYFCLYGLIVPNRRGKCLCRLADFSGLNGRSLDVDRDISL